MSKELWKDEDLFTMATSDEERRDFALSFAYQYLDSYQKDVRKNYWFFTILTVATLLGSALAPILAAFSLSAAWVALPSAFAGFATAMNSAFHFHEQWIGSFATLSAIDVEVVKFREQSAPDYGPDKELRAAVTAFQRKIAEVVNSDVKLWRKKVSASAHPKAVKG